MLRRHIIRATNTIGELWLIYAALIIAAAIGFSWAEHMNLGQAIWWAIVTATTTGYGDVYPHTLAGKIVAGILMHAAILVVLPLMIGRLITTLIEDQDKFTDEEQREVMVGIAELRAAAKVRPWVIQASDGRYLHIGGPSPDWKQGTTEAIKFWDEASAASYSASLGEGATAVRI